MNRCNVKASLALIGMECTTAATLLEAFVIGAVEYFAAVDKLTSFVGAHDQFEVANRYTKQASAKCRAARLALENHLADHKCGSAPSTV
jgi:hypothetical protein